MALASVRLMTATWEEAWWAAAAMECSAEKGNRRRRCLPRTALPRTD